VITKTDVIVIRSTEYSESSLISTVLSQEHGKISLMVRGARKPRSRFSGMIQPGNLLDVVYYYKPTRSVQTLTEASYRVRMDLLNRDIEKMALSMCALELIGQLLHEGEVNHPVFEFAQRFLIWLDRSEGATPATFPYLQIRLASLIGLELRLEGVEPGDAEGYLNIEAGIVSQSPRTPDAVRLTPNQLAFLVNSSRSRKVSILQGTLEQTELRSLIVQLDRYFYYHLDGLRPRRSDSIFDQILKP